MKLRWRSSFIAQAASIWFAWICWALAYWWSAWWLVALSVGPYLRVNRFGHLLDRRRADNAAGRN